MRVCLLCALLACGDNFDGSDDLADDTSFRIVLEADTAHPGPAIPERFLGASYETSVVVTDPAYFTAENQALAAAFAQLGIRSLRLGGNEADLGPVPSDAQIQTMLGFVDAADLELLYTLRLRTFDPAAAAATARAMLDRSDRIACFSVGNEADWYLDTFEDYAASFRSYVTAIGDSRARFCAPDSGDTAWVAQFASKFGPDDAVVLANLHEYFGGNGQGIDAAGGRQWMLSDEIVHWYGVAFDEIAPAGRTLPVRLAETNSYANGGCPGASDAFASTLWGLDYLHYWASRGAAGVSFHTGDHVSGATTTYSLFKTSVDGYHVHPLGYAVKAFALGGHGRAVPLAIADPIGVRFTAYAVLADDGALAITIINKSRDPGRFAIRAEATTAEIWRLAAASIDATDGVTLGGAPIRDDASWSGAPELVDAQLGFAMVDVPAESAAIVRLR